MGVFIVFYLGMEDLTANALIEILKAQNKDNIHGSTFITYKRLEEYGTEVVKILLESNSEAVFLLSRNNTNAMYRDYGDLFEECESREGLGIALKEGVELNDLISTFRGYLPLSVLEAFSDKRSVALLGVAA